MATTRARRWCFTEYELAANLGPNYERKYDDEKSHDDAGSTPAVEAAQRRVFQSLGEAVRYAIIQLERCPDTGLFFVVFVFFSVAIPQIHPPTNLELYTSPFGFEESPHKFRSQLTNQLFYAGRCHFQGYASFTKAYRLSGLKKLLKTAHWTVCKGTETENIEYCSKEDSRIDGPWSTGTPSEPGKRNDIHAVRDMIAEGKSLTSIMNDPQIGSYQALRGAELLFKYQPLPTNFVKRNVYWFHGSTGSGKSRLARDMATEAKEDLWVSAKDLQWFSRFNGEKWCLLDDFRSSHVSFSFLLRLLDGYAVTVPVKGTNAIWHPDTIIITCPVHPKFTYTKKFEQDNGNLDQLLRRITEIRLIGDEVVPNEVQAQSNNFVSLSQLPPAIRGIDLSRRRWRSRSPPVRRGT